MPALSIIIPTLNRGGLLLDTVAQLFRQRFQDFEVWVIDQSDSADATLVRRGLEERCPDPRVHYLHLDGKGLPNARNQGLARAAGSIVLFLDDDVLLLSDTFLDAHMDAYADPDVGGVSGRIVERSNRPNIKRTACYVSLGGRTVTNLSGFEPIRLHSLKGLNMSYRAAVFTYVGGFDRNYVGTALLEETDFSTRVARDGWTLLFEPAAELVHLSARTGGVRVDGAITRECSRFRATAYYVAKNRGALAMLPFAMTFGLIALARAARWSRPSAVRLLAKAAADGWRASRVGPDQSIPELRAPAPRAAMSRLPHMAVPT